MIFRPLIGFRLLSPEEYAPLKPKKREGKATMLDDLFLADKKSKEEDEEGEGDEEDEDRRVSNSIK
jgi:hypothetical protein